MVSTLHALRERRGWVIMPLTRGCRWQARGFLATDVEIGHGEVLLELVHNNENLNETIGPKAGIRIKVNFT